MFTDVLMCMRRTANPMQQAAFPMVSTGLPQAAMPPANGRMGDFAALRGEQHTAALEGLLQAQRNGPVSGTGLQLACVLGDNHAHAVQSAGVVCDMSGTGTRCGSGRVVDRRCQQTWPQYRFQHSPLMLLVSARGIELSDSLVQPGPTFR
jgi:hypothetical protein